MTARSVLAVATVAVTALAAPSGVWAQAPPGDSVIGEARDCAAVFDFCFHPISVAVDARSGPSGENPTGEAEWSIVLGSNTILGDRGPVSCLAVDGNTAIIGFRGAPNGNTLVRVVDGGSAPGQDSFAAVTRFILDDVVLPPPDCSSFPPLGLRPGQFSGSGVNLFGDIRVVDAPPLPTSKDQCKNGGWGSFGVFKNQGDCVSLVATGGKNPPGSR
jgi:hypothetical protein